MKLRLHWRHEAAGKSSALTRTEDYDVAEVTDLVEAFEYSNDLINEFNRVEWQRFGANAALRVLRHVELVGESEVGRAHSWAKMNLVTKTSGGLPFDEYQCSKCGCKARRYGLGERFTRVGKFSSNAYAYCNE
jgi:hypothetical protein